LQNKPMQTFKLGKLMILESKSGCAMCGDPSQTSWVTLRTTENLVAENEQKYMQKREKVAIS
jgi:hypothetical protein